VPVAGQHKLAPDYQGADIKRVGVGARHLPRRPLAHHHFVKALCAGMGLEFGEGLGLLHGGVHDQVV
jgi:hypothetical protein